MARYKMHVVNPRLLYLLESFLKKKERRGSFEQQTSLNGLIPLVFQRLENIPEKLQMWN